MKLFLPLVLVLGVFLSACAPDEFQGKNPKTADVKIENNVVTIMIPTSSPYFWLQKVNDDSVDYEQIFFRYDSNENQYFFRTDLDEWQPISPDEDSFVMGLVLIEINEKEITITYPSDTWAFP
jgi:hypothetical protein